MKWTARAPARPAESGSATEGVDGDNTTVSMSEWGNELRKIKADGRKVVRMEYDWTNKRVTLVTRREERQGDFLW